MAPSPSGAPYGAGPPDSRPGAPGLLPPAWGLWLGGLGSAFGFGFSFRLSGFGLSAWISLGFRLDSRLDLDLARLRLDLPLIWLDLGWI